MSTSDYAAMGQPYIAEEIEKMEGADVNRLAGGGGDESRLSIPCKERRAYCKGNGRAKQDCRKAIPADFGP